MEFHINSPQGNGGISSAEGNDRLQKAIERNRAKQARRQAPTGATVGSPGNRFGNQAMGQARSTSGLPQDWQSPAPNTGMSATASRFEDIQNRFENMSSGGTQMGRSSTPSHVRRPATAQSTMTRSGIVAPGGPAPSAASRMGQATTASRMTPQASTATSNPMGRRSVSGLNQEQKIIETPPPKRKAAANIKYTTPKKSTKKKKKVAANSTIKNLVKGAWVLCLVLLVRLVFTDGGIIDYYSTKSLLKLKVNELKAIKEENNKLADEIERIKSDKIYQKKLVRDNLGFIANNEYLVLFPKSSHN